MNAQTSYSAVVKLSETEQYSLHTFFYGGHWKWSGSHIITTGFDSLGCKVYELLDTVDCGLSYWESSEDAIADAVARFDGTENQEHDPANGICLHCGGDCDDRINFCSADCKGLYRL